MLFDTRNRLVFFSRLEADDMSLLQVLRKADKSFEIRKGCPAGTHRPGTDQTAWDRSISWMSARISMLQTRKVSI